MKVRERKFSTEEGLEALQLVINSLNNEIRGDVGYIVSLDFRVKTGSVDGDTGFWGLYEDEICFYANDAETYEHEKCSLKDVYSVDFNGCLTTLVELIKRYNILSHEKDMEIESFLEAFSRF